MKTLNFAHITKSYVPGQKVLEDITFSIKKGEIVGLIGPNGAGKTTLLRLAAGILQPTSGKIEIGVKKECIAYMPANKGLLSPLSVKDNLKIWSEAYNASEEDVAYLIDRLSLKNILAKEVRTLSSGMKMMTSFICTILGKPELVLLDEPFVHLDVEGCLEVVDVLKTFLKESAIIISSHDLEYVDEISDSFLILSNGKQKLFNTADCLKGTYGSCWFKISFHGRVEARRKKQIEEQYGANFIEPSIVYFPHDRITPYEAKQLLIKEKCSINSVIEKCSELKDIYLNLQREA